ncbi:hypothetical protein GCM10009092_22980 [Bowmanella denitrificans]|uniref:VanZ-like domain-containing protein n=1 Tax=Bowmanella denitrificans TaxID=366582 RepID=A0ABN0X8Z9_9ALTE
MIYKYRFFFFVGFLFFLVTILMGEIYRGWIINSQVNDFGFSGVAPSFFSTVSFIFFAAYIKKRVLATTEFLACVLGCVVYEAIQPYIGLGVFDLGDVSAILFGGVLSFLLLNILHKVCSLDDNIINKTQNN